MIPEPTVDIDAAFEAGTPIDEAMNEALLAAVARHKQSGVPMVVWKDGKPVEIMADEVGKSDTTKQST